MKGCRNSRRKRRALFGLVATSAALLPLHGANAATPAGTTIRNVAQVSYDLGRGAAALDSNVVDIRVGEVIELTVEPAPACGLSIQTGGKTAVGFLLTNRGNGREAFIPDAPGIAGGSDFVSEAVVADSNRNGCYDPGTDSVIPDGDATPELAPGESIVLFVVGTYRRTLGTITLRVKSTTGSGVTGTVFAGAGDGGSDAVIGIAGGAVDGQPGTPQEPLAASLVKSQSVRAPDGSARAVRGAVITYRIEGRFTGNGVASDVAIDDAIPAGTTYVPGTLTLDDAALSDGGDDDSGRFDGGAIAVRLGDVAAPAVRTVTFQVIIN